MRGATRQGYAVITGGELGVSRLAAGLVAESGGRLVDVLGGGLREHLKNDAVARLLAESRAAVLSTEHPDALFTVNHAIARNKLLFALADAAFIFNTDGRRGELDALQNRTCDWIYAWQDYAGNQPLIARGAVPFHALTDGDFDEMSRHWSSSRAQQMNMFDLLDRTERRKRQATGHRRLSLNAFQVHPLHRPAQLLLPVRVQRAQGQAQGVFDPAHHRQRGLDGDGVDLVEQQANQRQVFQLRLQALLRLALQPVGHHFAHHPGDDVGGHGDHAPRAQRHGGGHLVVVAAVDGDALAAGAGQVRHLPQAPGGLLHGAQVRVLRQLRHGVGVQVHAGAGGHVVHDDGDVHAVGHGVVVADQPRPAGPVVVGRHHQQRVRAQPLGLDGLGDGPPGVVAARAHDQRRPMGAAGRGALYDRRALAA